MRKLSSLIKSALFLRVTRFLLVSGKVPKLPRLAKFIPFAVKTLTLRKQNCNRALARTALLFLLLVGGYYLLFLAPQIRHSRALSEVELAVGKPAFNLLQNRIAFVELTRLDPQTGNFNFEKSALVSTLQKTGQDGLEQQAVKIPWIRQAHHKKIDPQLKERFPALIAETKEVYQRQAELLTKVFATSSYAAGIAILRSPEAVALLTKQTNLILEYQFWLAEIN